MYKLTEATGNRSAFIRAPRTPRNSPIEPSVFVSQLSEYLPGNYSVEGAVVAVDGSLLGALIVGQDKAGWTLEDYVLPRLASGLLFGEEL